MEDFLKRKLEIGDSVIFLVPNQRFLVLGRVINFGKVQVRIQYMKPGYQDPKEVSRYPSEVVRVDGPELTMYLLKK